MATLVVGELEIAPIGHRSAIRGANSSSEESRRRVFVLSLIYPFP